MNKGSLAIVNARLITPVDNGEAKSGAAMKELQDIARGTVLIIDGTIAAVGPSHSVAVPREVEVIDAQGRLVTPGLVDPHTHLVHAGSREHEVPLKLAGASYMEIHRAGGGIASTVRATRKASDQELLGQAREAALQMLAYGVTTVESKSGYGLSTEQEIRMLEVAHQLADQVPLDVVHTFLGAHSIPEEYRDRPEAYVQLVIEEMLPRVAELGLARFCDVFCEQGVFDVEQSRRILKSASELGFRLKLHADEIESIGGAELAAELGAVSADHLMAASDAGLKAMAQAGVIAVLLPGTSFYLRKQYARARRMIVEGVPVALATDFNPGSCPSENLQFIMNLAYLYLGMYPAEILTATTLNAAYAVGCGRQLGSLTVGKQGDVVIWNAENLEYLVYRFGRNHVCRVVKRGKLVV